MERLSAYQLGEEIGKGGFGNVYSGTKDGNTFAIKICEDKEDDSYEDMLKRELKLLRRVQGSPYVIELVESFDFENDDSVFTQITVMPFYPTDLDALIEKLRDDDRLASWHSIKELTLSMLHALKHCAKKRVVHGDVKPNNILVQLHKSGELSFVLADFGSSHVLGKSKVCHYGHTQLYSAPEVVLEEWKRVNFTSDTWSLACCVFEMACGEMLFRYEDEEYEEETADESAGEDAEGILQNAIEDVLILQHLGWDSDMLSLIHI